MFSFLDVKQRVERRVGVCLVKLKVLSGVLIKSKYWYLSVLADFRSSCGFLPFAPVTLANSSL